MIIYRYLSRQLLSATLAISFVLTVILVGGRLMKYVEEAAQGRIAGDVLFILVAYRLPDFLQLILPLGLFLGILLAYGRLYLDGEMTVLQACGLGPGRLVQKTLWPVIGMALVVALMTVYLTPLGAQYSERLQHAQRNQSAFQTLTPGYFHVSEDASRVTYARSLSKGGKQMEQLFIAEDQPGRWVVVNARSGTKRFDEKAQAHYLQLETGRRYEGRPGSPDVRVTTFQSYTVRLEAPTALGPTRRIKSESTGRLWQRTDPAAQAEWQWRLSIPLLVPLVAWMAIPLSRVNARQGRYLKMLPAILLYLSYLVLLSNAKAAVEKEHLSPAVGLWSVHGLFFCIALGLNTTAYWSKWKRKIPFLFQRRALG